MALDDLQTPRARVAWLSDSGGFAYAFGQFAKAGYLLTEAGLNAPADLAVIDIRGKRIAPKAIQDLGDLARRAAPDCGVVFVGCGKLTASERAHLRRSGDFALATDDLGLLIDACRQRLRLRNVAEETGERLKSVAASTRLSEFPPIETSSAAPSVLVAGEPGPAALAALAAAEAVAGRVAGAMTAAQAMRSLESGAFDCAVILPASEGDPLLGLARSMRRRQKFQDLPVIAVAANALDLNSPRFGAGFAAETLAGAHLADDLSGRILAVTRRARLAGAMRRFLGACAGDGVRDRLSGAFAPQFFASHAERVFARADATGRPLSLAALRLAAVGGDDQETSSARTLTEAARLINRVTRAEDFVARLAYDTFVIVMPSTTERDAAGAAKRFEGVIANTMFRARSDQRPFAVAAATAASERAKGMRVEEAVAAVLSRLMATTPKTAER